MKWAQLSSLILHTALLGYVLWEAPVKLPLASSSSFPIEIISTEQRAPRQQRRKGSKKKKQKAKRSSVKPALKKKVIEGDGDDTKNVSAIRASGPEVTRVVNSYVHELQRYIESRRFYPRRAMRMAQTGQVKVKFVIHADGTFSNIQIVESSPFPSLNKAAKDLMVSLKSFRPLPKEYSGSGEFVVPINYQLKKSI